MPFPSLFSPVWFYLHRQRQRQGQGPRHHVRPLLTGSPLLSHSRRPKSQAAFSYFSRKQEKPFAPGTPEHIQPARARSFAWTSTKDSNNSGMMSRANPCGDCPYFEVKFVTRTLRKHSFVQRTLPKLILCPPHRKSTIWFVTHYII